MLHMRVEYNLFLMVMFCCFLHGMEEQRDNRPSETTAEEVPPSFNVFGVEHKNLYELGYRANSDYFVVELGDNKIGTAFNVSKPLCKVVEPSHAGSVKKHVLVYTIKKLDLFEKNNVLQDYIETFKDNKAELMRQNDRIVYDLRTIECMHFQDSLSESGKLFVANQFQLPARRPPKKSHPVIGGIILVSALFLLWHYFKKR